MRALIIWPGEMDDASLSFPGHVPSADSLPMRAPSWWILLPRPEDPPNLELLKRVRDGLRRL
jgi:hypothetical protein